MVLNFAVSTYVSDNGQEALDDRVVAFAELVSWRGVNGCGGLNALFKHWSDFVRQIRRKLNVTEPLKISLLVVTLWAEDPFLCQHTLQNAYRVNNIDFDNDTTY